MAKKSRRFRGDGCGFVLLTCLFMCCALLLNGMVAMVAVSALRSTLLADERLHGFVLFLMPIGMLVIQWWIVDQVVDWLSPQQEENGRPPEQP
ncbi:hypothetical protein [Lignipirellula cremea]|uniref:Transmembrane protein n=1 Tax=Lignipirellula cremea TaxID=2528010 RepID=A0A518DPH5_9BACT|nr:hypothetical protein [Lignipirellula cremea]QDU93741.1 hypothetical protein Pla8534_15240 [Lignipirellula cremea]